jgi:predicted dehydrogenase
MAKVKYAIIGFGGIAENRVAKEGYACDKKRFKPLKKAVLTGATDVNPARQAAAEALGLKWYPNAEAVFADPAIDAVYIATNNASHAKLALAALKAGKHVICEKPMATSYEEAVAMCEAAKKNGKLLTIGYQNRQTKEQIYAHRRVENGELGEIYFARAHALRRRAIPNWGVFLKEDEHGGGPLIDIGTHALDLTLWTMDNYKPKYCVGTTYHALNKQTEQGNDWGNWDTEKFTVEDSAFGFVVMENGATVYLEASWALNTLDTREAVTQLCGTLGGADMIDGLRFNGIRNNQKYMFIPQLEGKGAAFYSASKQPSASDLEARRWIDAIKNDTDPVVTPDQAIVVTKILEGIYRSAASGDIYRF